MLLRVPEVNYVVSAELPPGSNLFALTGLVVSLIVLSPVVNLGLLASLGSGICKDIIKDPLSSLISDKSPTVA